MNVVVDTCVIIDAMQGREPFCKDAQSIFVLCANRRFDGLLTAKAVTDIYYLTHRLTHSRKETLDILTRICTLFRILDTTAEDIRNAFLMGIPDFEDAVMIETAKRSRADCIVTRNLKDYHNSPIRVYHPSDFVALLLESSK